MLSDNDDRSENDSDGNIVSGSMANSSVELERDGQQDEVGLEVRHIHPQVDFLWKICSQEVEMRREGDLNIEDRRRPRDLQSERNVVNLGGSPRDQIIPDQILADDQNAIDFA